MKKLGGTVFFLLLLFVSLGTGAGECSWGDVFALLAGRDVPESVRVILFEVRLPRICAALLAGGMLAAAGAAVQNLFRNDLASPHVLGAVNASALGAVAGLYLGIGWTVFPALGLGMASLGLLWQIGARRDWSGTVLILSGIALNACTSALTSGAMFLAGERLTGMLFWLLGGFGMISWTEVVILGISALAGWGILWKFRRETDLLLLGERTAELSGVPLKRLKPWLLFAVAVLTAGAVSCCGAVGFVGLAVPHIARLSGALRFPGLLRRSVWMGGVLLVTADLAARSLAAPLEIPVGILTALCGGPFFVWLLLKKGHVR